MKQSGFFLITLVSILLSACSSQKSEEKNQITFQVSALGEHLEDIRFFPDTLVAKQGSEIRVILTNNSQHISMFHNIVFCAYGKGQKVGFEGIQAGAKNDYVNPKSKFVIAHSKMLKPNEIDTLIFDAPPVGKYDFICSFPGHYSIMNGVLTIK